MQGTHTEGASFSTVDLLVLSLGQLIKKINFLNKGVNCTGSFPSVDLVLNPCRRLVSAIHFDLFNHAG